MITALPLKLACLLTSLLQVPDTEPWRTPDVTPAALPGLQLWHSLQVLKVTYGASGEGGAGTWSDGKLTTKVGRNSDPVRHVLQILFQFGAPQVNLSPVFVYHQAALSRLDSDAPSCE